MNKMNRRNFLKTAGKFTLVGVTAFSFEQAFLSLALGSFKTHSIIEIGNCEFKAAKEEVKKLKGIFDKLEKYYILDNVVFNSTEPTVKLMKAVYEVDFWIVGEDGGVSLKSMYGHNGKYKYENIYTDRLPEFNEGNLKWLNTKLNSGEVNILREIQKICLSNSRWGQG